MHVLIIPSEPYIPREEPLAGIFQHDQAVALAEKGHRIGVLSLYLKSMRSALSWSSLSTSGIRYTHDHGIEGIHCNFFAPYAFPSVVLHLWVRIGLRLFKKYMAKHGMPDLLHAHNTSYAGILCYYIHKKYGIKYLITEHSSDFARGKIPSSYQPFIRKTLETTSGLITVSPLLADLMQSTYPEIRRPPQWIPNILNGQFEREVFHTIRSSENEPFILLNIASMNANKGQKNLLHAFALFHKTHPNAVLRIGGNGELRKELEQTVQALEISEQVIFLGELNREQVIGEMIKCHVFVLSSFYETFGVVLIEALSCGRPVISTRAQGPECIVTEENGKLCLSGNPESLAEAMQQLYDNYTSYDQAAIRSACISSYGKEKIVQLLSEMYQKTISSH